MEVTNNFQGFLLHKKTPDKEKLHSGIKNQPINLKTHLSIIKYFFSVSRNISFYNIIVVVFNTDGLQGFQILTKIYNTIRLQPLMSELSKRPMISKELSDNILPRS